VTNKVNELESNENIDYEKLKCHGKDKKYKRTTEIKTSELAQTEIRGNS